MNLSDYLNNRPANLPVGVTRKVMMDGRPFIPKSGGGRHVVMQRKTLNLDNVIKAMSTIRTGTLVDIAKIAEMSTTTARNYVSQLIESGVVVEDTARRPFLYSLVDEVSHG